MNVIGQGSFGTVYKAFWRGTIVAAKVIPMPATTHERAQKEIDMCRRVYIRYGWIILLHQEML